MAEQNPLFDQWDQFAAWARTWNAAATAPEFYKNGRPKPRRKKPIDALCVVRKRPEEVLVWDAEAKKRAVERLLEEEEKRAAEGMMDLEEDDS